METKEFNEKELNDFVSNYKVKIQELAESMDLVSPTGKVFGYGMFTFLDAYRHIAEKHGCKGPSELDRYIEKLEHMVYKLNNKI